MDHYDDIVNSVARRSILEDCYAEIVELMGEENAPPPDYFLEVYGRTVINSFNILDPIEQVCHGYHVKNTFFAMHALLLFYIQHLVVCTICSLYISKEASLVSVLLFGVRT